MLRRRGKTLIGVLASVLVVGGCGGRLPVYELEATKRCLEEQGLTVSTRNQDLDFVALTALGGGLRTKVDDKVLGMAFGETAEDGERIENAYRRFAPKGYPIQDVIRRDRNAVMLWALPPTPEEHGLVTGCLKT